MFDNNLSCLNNNVQNIVKFVKPILNLKVNSLLKDNNVLKIISLKTCCTKNIFSY